MIRTIKKIQTNVIKASAFYSLLLSFLFFSSCAWNQKAVKTYKKQGDLVKKFEINNDQIKKFAEKEVVEKPAKVAVKTTKSKVSKKTKITLTPNNPKYPKIRKLQKTITSQQLKNHTIIYLRQQKNP